MDWLIGAATMYVLGLPLAALAAGLIDSVWPAVREEEPHRSTLVIFVVLCPVFSPFVLLAILLPIRGVAE